MKEIAISLGASALSVVLVAVYRSAWRSGRVALVRELLEWESQMRADVGRSPISAVELPGIQSAVQRASKMAKGY